MLKQLFYTQVILLTSLGMNAQNSISNAVSQNINDNQMVVTENENTTYYNTNDIKNVSIDKTTGKIIITTNSNLTDTYSSAVSKLSFAKAVANSDVTITEAKGWQESAYLKWNLLSTADSYNVYVKGGQYSDYTKIDAELVRKYSSFGRADIVGLKAGTYSVRVIPVISGVEGKSSEVTGLVVSNYDRSGFAHKNYSGVGAYNNDGTLKDNAVVVYVDKSNAKTVSATLSSGTFTGIQAIITAYQKGNVTTPLDIRIIGLLKNGETDDFGSSSEGIQIKGKGADSELNITVEGIGDDATIHGFGFLVRNSKSIEFRNIGIMRQMDDGISLDTNNSNIWIHNVDVFYGKAGSGDHAKGDGAIDVKSNSKYVTIDYCHFWDTGKSSMCGMKSESGPNYITYHHNWFDHSDSRHARVRTMSVHMWNNYFDGCSKYGVGAVMGSSVFVENNYFRATDKPLLISLQGTDAKGEGTFSDEAGGMIKGYGNTFAEKGASSYFTPIAYSEDNASFDYYDAKTRDEVVPSSIVTISGGNKYDNFDTNASLMYDYTAQNAADVPATVTGYLGAGRINHGDLQYTFDNTTEDTNYAPISALETLIDTYAGEDVTHGSGSGTGTDTGDDTDPTDPTTGTIIDAETECNFSSGAPSNSAFTATSDSYSTSRGTVTVNGVEYEKAIKMDSKVNIAFVTDKTMTLTLVLGVKLNSISIDGTAVTGTGDTTNGYVVTKTIEAGTHHLTRGTGEAALFYIGLK